MADQFDLVVVGGGPGGYAAAFYGASAGLNVALVEKDTIGGTCLNRGCIPAKAFLETAAARRHAEHASDFGIDVTVGATDFAIAQARKQKIVDGLVKGLTGLVKVKLVVNITKVCACIPAKYPFYLFYLSFIVHATALLPLPSQPLQAPLNSA